MAMGVDAETQVEDADTSSVSSLERVSSPSLNVHLSELTDDDSDVDVDVSDVAAADGAFSYSLHDTRPSLQIDLETQSQRPMSEILTPPSSPHSDHPVHSPPTRTLPEGEVEPIDLKPNDDDGNDADGSAEAAADVAWGPDPEHALMPTATPTPTENVESEQNDPQDNDNDSDRKDEESEGSWDSNPNPDPRYILRFRAGGKGREARCKCDKCFKYGRCEGCGRHFRRPGPRPY